MGWASPCSSATCSPARRSRTAGRRAAIQRPERTRSGTRRAQPLPRAAINGSRQRKAIGDAWTSWTPSAAQMADHREPGGRFRRPGSGLAGVVRAAARSRGGPLGVAELPCPRGASARPHGPSHGLWQRRAAARSPSAGPQIGKRPDETAGARICTPLQGWISYRNAHHQWNFGPLLPSPIHTYIRRVTHVTHVTHGLFLGVTAIAGVTAGGAKRA